jgi:uncharacterized protein (DUF1330 family)
MARILPAYFVAMYIITNPELFRQYQELALPMLKTCKCKVLTLGQAKDVVGMIIEGNENFDMVVVIEFDSEQEALDWYNDPEYQKILHMRLQSTRGFGIIVKGLEPHSA